jgi:hypothetical protein
MAVFFNQASILVEQDGGIFVNIKQMGGDKCA